MLCRPIREMGRRFKPAGGVGGGGFNVTYYRCFCRFRSLLVKNIGDLLEHG
jgi:hypothetical protein